MDVESIWIMFDVWEITLIWKIYKILPSRCFFIWFCTFCAVRHSACSGHTKWFANNAASTALNEGHSPKQLKTPKNSRKFANLTHILNVENQKLHGRCANFINCSYHFNILVIVWCHINGLCHNISRSIVTHFNLNQSNLWDICFNYIFPKQLHFLFPCFENCLSWDLFNQQLVDSGLSQKNKNYHAQNYGIWTNCDR